MQHAGSPAQKSLIPTVPPGEDELPHDDGEPMESEQHRRQMNVLVDSLDLAWRDRNDFYVGGNMAVYFSELQVKKNDFRAPDVFVVLDTVRRVRKSWVVWQEGGRLPDVVIELLSESTEETDRGEKMRVYRLLRVGHYYLFDPLDGRFEGYALDPNRNEYVRMEPEQNGDVLCPTLGLRLGVRHGVLHGVESDWLRWIDARGEVLPIGEELARDAERKREDAERKREDEARRREDAERRLAEALAEIERLKGASS